MLLCCVRQGKTFFAFRPTDIVILAYRLANWPVSVAALLGMQSTHLIAAVYDPQPLQDGRALRVEERSLDSCAC